MKHSWKEVKLSEILKLNVDSVDVLSQPEFHFAGVYCFGNGLFEKGYLSGAETTYKTYNRLHKNHITISKVKGWEGAIALVTDEFDGMFLSPVYPTFNLISEEIADIKYIDLFLKQKHVWQKLLENSKGIGARRNSVSERQFLDLSIPLPPRSEQQRIVSKIEGIKNKLNRIKDIRAEQENEIQSYLFSVYFDAEKKFPNKPLTSFLIPSTKSEEPKVGESYRQVGVRWWGGGAYERETIDGSQTSYSTFFKLEKNSFIFNKIWVRNGALAIVKENTVGCYASSEFPNFLYDDKVILPQWLDFIINQPIFWQRCANLSQGTSGKNRIKPSELLKLEIPIPTINQQNNIVKTIEHINSLKQFYKLQEQELSKFMPSLLDKAFKGELTYSKQEDSQLLAAEQTSKYHAKAKSLIPENKKSFAKQVLGGKIVSLFRDDKNFTHIKFQKLQYIAEHIIEEDLHWNYYRQTAGPYDNKFMHSVIYNLSRNKWFEENDYKFYPLAKATEIDKYYQTYFGDKNDKLNKLFCLLKNATEKFCEAVATIYAVWNNHIIQKVEFDLEKIRQDFFAWSNRKENLFSNEEFELALQWMQKYSIEPTGFGQVIKEKK